MTTTDTPRTDEQIWYAEYHHETEAVVDADYAKQIERELAASRAEVRRLESDKAHLITYCANLLEAANLLQSKGITRISKDWGKAPSVER